MYITTLCENKMRQKASKKTIQNKKKAINQETKGKRWLIFEKICCLSEVFQRTGLHK